MKVSAQISSSLAAKATRTRAPKRAVSFVKNCKYEPSLRKHCHSDAQLQSENKLRKCQRRGSKTPAMLLLSKEDLSIINDTADNAGRFDIPLHQHQEQQAGVPRRPSRRLSIMSTLKQNLERSCNIGPSGTLRRLSLERKHSIGLSALLSPM